eukprot:4385963-Alexandrium_andersonii.AAC.1
MSKEKEPLRDLGVSEEVVREIQTHPWSLALSRSTTTPSTKFRTVAMSPGGVRRHVGARVRTSWRRRPL